MNNSKESGRNTVNKTNIFTDLRRRAVGRVVAPATLAVLALSSAGCDFNPFNNDDAVATPTPKAGNVGTLTINSNTIEVGPTTVAKVVDTVVPQVVDRAVPIVVDKAVATVVARIPTATPMLEPTKRPERRPTATPTPIKPENPSTLETGIPVPSGTRLEQGRQAIVREINWDTKEVWIWWDNSLDKAIEIGPGFDGNAKHVRDAWTAKGQGVWVSMGEEAWKEARAIELGSLGVTGVTVHFMQHNGGFGKVPATYR